MRFSVINQQRVILHFDADDKILDHVALLNVSQTIGFKFQFPPTPLEFTPDTFLLRDFTFVPSL